MTPEPHPDKVVPSDNPTSQELRRFSTAVDDYHKAVELHEYARNITDSYNQNRIRLAQQEDKVRRMQASFSWRCTAWLRALRRKFWDPSHPPASTPPEVTGLIGCPYAIADFSRPATSAFNFEITGGLDQLATGKDCTLRGWIKGHDQLKVLGIRARLGEKIFAANTAQSTEGATCSITFELKMHPPADDQRIDLEIGSDAAGWFLFHRIPLVSGTSHFLNEHQPTMARNQAHYSRWTQQYDTLTPAQIRNLRLRAKKLPRQPLISLVMPVFNPDESHLRRAIESVKAQAYENWELCIADDASTASHVRPILENYAAQDARIKTIFRTENGHISIASNSALELATGDFCGLIDHDDEIPPQALFYIAECIGREPDLELVYTDEDKITNGGVRFDPHFKPDWNPDLLRSQNYLCHLVAYRTTTLKAKGGLRTGFEGAQDWDLALRFTENLDPAKIRHIPRILYHWRAIEGSTAMQLRSKDYALRSAQRALQEHLSRIGLSASVEVSEGQHWHVRYSVPDPAPLVTLIIPTRNGLGLLSRCVESIRAKTSYPNFEFLIADNGSDDPELLAYLDKKKLQGRFTVLSCPGPFNFSAINNLAARSAQGNLIGFLNNDLEALHPDWLSEMVGHATRPGIGAVGAKLLYPDQRVQHAGIITGLGGVAGHAFKHFSRNDPGTPQFRPHVTQNISAVTAACLVVRKSVFEQAGGFDEANLRVAFNDVDLCLRINAQGFRNVFTPFAELIHHESASRGSEYTPDRLPRFTKEIEYMRQRWGARLQQDPAYNPNLTVDTEDFSLAFPPRHDEQA